MKRLSISIIVILALVISSASVVLAAKPTKWDDGGKPLEVIARSNGFPSGQHFNLNLHGKDCSYNGTPTGNVIVIPLYSSCNTSVNSTIEYISNKRNRSNLELDVLDPLVEHFDGDPAQVYLPYNILDESDNVIKPADGYYVIGRILGKPNNGKDPGTESSIILSQNILFYSENFTDNASANSTWPYDPVDPEFTVGLIDSGGNMYTANETHFIRFDPPTDDPNEPGGDKAQKRGKSKGVEITELFMWEGLVADNDTYPDNNSNGIIDIGDFDTDNATLMAIYDTNEPYGEITWDEFVVWAQDNGATYYDGVWIFEVADMVISRQTVLNDGTRNFQIRFYPRATTNFKLENNG